MKATKTMREMMVVASLFALSACGAVEPADTAEFPPDESIEMGSGSGWDSGSIDAGIPLACMKASECGAGMMCDLSSNTCMTPSLTVADDGFVVQGATWWSAVSDPVLHGTFDGPFAAVVQVIVGSEQGKLATIDGNEWTVQLTPGSVTATETWIKVLMTDPSGGMFEVRKRVMLDVVGPNIALEPSFVKDERGDSIDFSTGEPVHTHVGPNVELSSSACPTIYKYAYLMDASVPYGRGTSPNPLAWKFSISDTKLDPSSIKFKVRTDDHQVVLWRPVPAPNIAGIYTVELTRRGGTSPVAFLDEPHVFHIDLVARDWSGNETAQTVCWNHVPLAAPVSVEPFSGDELFAVDLLKNTPFASMLYRSGDSVGLVHQRIVQQTAEPVTLTWAGVFGDINYSTRNFNDKVVDSSSYSGVICPSGNTKPECRINWAPTQQYSGMWTQTGKVDRQLWRFWLEVVDEQSGQVLATTATDYAHTVSFSLPARPANTAPHGYRIVARAEFLPWLSPGYRTGFLLGDHALMGLTYTGAAPELLGVSCAHMTTTAFGPMCQTQSYHYYFTAVDHARVEFTGLASTITQRGMSASYIPASAAISAALVWDSGDDDLPGMF